jgi:hypothetical protein
VALQTPTTYAGWVHLAERRLLNVLSVRVAANIRQLEVKISESGPDGIRPEPHILNAALQNLLNRGRLRIVYAKRMTKAPDTRFYTLSENYPEPANRRVAELMVPYRIFRMLTDTQEWCADVLENVIRASFDTDDRYTFKGKLPKERPLDATYEFGPFSKTLIGIEAKNIREWVYPMTAEVWLMIAKCLTLDALPLLVARKIGYLTRAVFAKLGIMGFEVHRQVFHPDVAHLLVDIQHTDRLGYKDVVVMPARPYGPLAAFVQSALAVNLLANRLKWTHHRALLEEFAFTRNLGSRDMNDTERQQHGPEFMEALFGHDPRFGHDAEGTL